MMMYPSVDEVVLQNVAKITSMTRSDVKKEDSNSVQLSID